MDSEKASNFITSSEKIAKVFSDALKTRATTTLHRADPQVATYEPQIDIAIIEESKRQDYKLSTGIPSPKKYPNRVLNFEENYSMEMEENRSSFQSMINKVPQLESSLYFSHRHSSFVSPADSFLSSERSNYWSMMKAADLSSNFDLQKELNLAESGAVVLLPNREIEVSGLVIRKPVTIKGLKNTRLVIVDPVLIRVREGAVVSVMNMLIDSNSFEKKNTSTFKEANLFIVETAAALRFWDCRVEGSRNLSLVSAERLQSLTLESCHVKNMKQLGAKKVQVLQISSCFFEQFSLRVIELASVKEASIEKTYFVDNLVGCIHFSLIDSPVDVKLWIRDCEFANNPGTAVEIKGPRPHGSEVTVGIFGCRFKDSPANQVTLSQAVFKSCSVEDCNFEAIGGKCISLSQARNYSVSRCEFSRFEDEAIAVTGGNGKVDNCSMRFGESGVRVTGEALFQHLHSQDRGSNSSRKPEAQVNPTLQVSRTKFSNMRQAAVEVSDTQHLDFLLESCTIDRGVTGVLIRDVQQDLRLDTSTAHGDPRLDIQATPIDPRAANGSSVFERGRLVLLNNLITNNLGSGVKIETPLTPVVIEGGQILGNRDHSVGVIGSKHKHLLFGVGAKQPKLDRPVEEIDFGQTKNKPDPCTLI